MSEQGSFSKETVKGMWRDNPVFVQFLGLCPSLAVTNSVINGIAMAVAASFVLIGSCVLVSAIRKVVPKQVRITAYIVIIATFVQVADYTLQALAPMVYKQLGAFIPLIVVNCIILGRAEAFASKNAVVPSLGDAVGNSLGFGLALLILGSIRELLGSGSLLGIPVFGPTFEPWVIMILPPGGFLTMGVLLMVFAQIKKSKARKAAVALGREAA